MYCGNYAPITFTNYIVKRCNSTSWANSIQENRKQIDPFSVFF